MTEPLIITCLFGLALLLLSWLRQLALWQRKEYRFDRLWSAFTSQELTSETSFGLYIFYGSTALAWTLYLLALHRFTSLLGWLALLGLTLHIGLDIARRGLV